jgi:hypothetical protein
MTVISAAMEFASLDLLIGAVTEGIGRVWRRVTTRAVCLTGTCRHVRLWSGANLLQIIRSIPYRVESRIGFPDVAAMKGWKGLTTILKAGGGMWTTGIMRQS